MPTNRTSFYMKKFKEWSDVIKNKKLESLAKQVKEIHRDLRSTLDNCEQLVNMMLSIDGIPPAVLYEINI